MLEKEKLMNAVKGVENILANGDKLTNFLLLEICNGQGIKIIGNNNEGHLAHEIMEVAINNYISKRYLQGFEENNQSNLEILAELEAIERQIPPQSWRTSEQVRLQQFSTPPPVAYLLAKILNPIERELVLEPSAGTGSLAVWMKVAGCTIHVNELSEMRRALLELQDYKPTGINAEFLDDLLPDEIAPEGVLMNPPFSANGGRTKKTDSNFGFRHVKSALVRLKEGGRLVALLRADALTKSDKGRRFLSEIAAEYDLRAVITLPKKAFYKYGTNFQTCIVYIVKSERTPGEKSIKQRKNILEADCQSLEECLSYVSIFD